MKKIHLFVLSLFLIGALNTINLAQDDMKAYFQNKADKISELVKAKDHEAMLAMYVEDAYSLPSYEPILHGMKEFKAQAEKNKDMPMEMLEFQLTTIDVFGSENMKVEIGKYELVIKMPEMDNMPDKGKYMTIWVKDGDSWKIKADTWNTDYNPWEMMEKDKKK